MRLPFLAAALALASPLVYAEDPATASADAPATADAPASAPAPAPPEPAPAPPPTGRGKGESRWGLLFDAGFPQGAGLSAAYRPAPSVRFFAGPAWDYTGFGLQGGISVTPWRFAVTPVLTAEAGRFFATNVSFLAKSSGGVPPELKPLLQDMTYTYGAVHVGLELGSQTGLSFSIDAGLAYILLETRGTVTKTDSSGSSVTFSDPRVRGTLPSLKLGIHYWF